MKGFDATKSTKARLAGAVVDEEAARSGRAAALPLPLGRGLGLEEAGSCLIAGLGAMSKEGMAVKERKRQIEREWELVECKRAFDKWGIKNLIQVPVIYERPENSGKGSNKRQAPVNTQIVC